jgi:hypothetical protein
VEGKTRTRTEEFRLELAASYQERGHNLEGEPLQDDCMAIPFPFDEVLEYKAIQAWGLE